MQTQTEKVINLQDLFAMNNEYFVKFLKERCFNKLNEFLKTKSDSTVDPFFVQTEGNNVRIGYTPREKKGRRFFSNELMDFGDDAISKAILTQYVIFEGCREYGCYEEVPMAGAPEEKKDAFFTFTHEGISYKYLIWIN